MKLVWGVFGGLVVVVLVAAAMVTNPTPQQLDASEFAGLLVPVIALVLAGVGLSRRLS